jgi:Adenine-specific methyltransferase EcoRI
VPDANNDGAIDLYDVEYLLKKSERNVLTLLAGDGDFRSAECVALLDEADIVVTNPPFTPSFRRFPETVTRLPVIRRLPEEVSTCLPIWFVAEVVSPLFSAEFPWQPVLRLPYHCSRLTSQTRVL